MDSRQHRRWNESVTGMPKPHHPNVKKTMKTYAADNLRAARIILSQVEKYGGDGSLMVKWARAITAGEVDLDKQWRLSA
jgi:hypothetical protein